LQNTFLDLYNGSYDEKCKIDAILLFVTL